MRRTRIKVSLVAALSAALLGAPPAFISAAAQPAPPQTGEEGREIVVTGDPGRRDPVAAFVEAVTVETGDQIARFDAPICPASVGLPPAQNRLVEARIGEIAAYLGRGAAAGCRPNVVIVVAEEGGDFVRRFRRERPALFAALRLSELRGIMALAGPVRAWQIVEPRGADGRPMERIAFIEGAGGPPRPVANGYRLTGVMPSLTARSTRQDLSLSFIVFDLSAIDGLSWLQIADHAAMRALARTGGAGLPARRSILTLFGDRRAGAEPARELTDWDAAYLRALYRTSNAVGAHQQRSNMARAMRRALARPPDGGS